MMLDLLSSTYTISFYIFVLFSSLCVLWYVTNKVLDMCSSLQEGGGRYALITGCDSGFGYLAAHELNRRGVFVFAACLTPQNVNTFEEDETFKGISFQMDITKKEDIDKAAGLIQSVVKDKGLHILLNNAGIGYFGPIEWLSEQHIRRTLDVNLLGHINVTKAALPMLKTAHGRIINISSVLGRVTFPFYSAYHMTKYALESFSDALRHEMSVWGVSVHIIEPGLMRTDLYRQVDQQVKNLWNDQSQETQLAYGENFFNTLVSRLNPENADKRASDPKQVIDAYVHAGLSTRPQLRYLIGVDAHILGYTIGVLPTWISDYLIKKIRKPIIPDDAPRFGSHTMCV